MRVFPILYHIRRSVRVFRRIAEDGGDHVLIVRHTGPDRGGFRRMDNIGMPTLAEPVRHAPKRQDGIAGVE